MKITLKKNMFFTFFSILTASKNNKKILKKNIIVNNKIKKTSEKNSKAINLNINFKDTELQNTFNTTKSFYINFLNDFFNIFKKNFNNSFQQKKQKIQLIKTIHDNYSKKIDNKLMMNIINNLLLIEFKKKYVNIDWQENIIKEIEITNLDKLLEIFIETMANSFALSELLTNKKITEEEFMVFLKEIYNYEKQEKEKITEINRSIEFKNLIINNINNENKINFEKIKDNKNDEETIGKIKTDMLFNDLVNNFVDSIDLIESEKKIINENIWFLIDFLNKMSNKYFDYFNNNQTNFITEVEIVKKIIQFKETNNFFKDFTLMEIYSLLKNLFLLKLEKINNKSYIFEINNPDKYSKLEIVNTNDYNKLKIVLNSFCLIIYFLNKNNQNNLKLNKSITTAYKVYESFYKQMTSLIETSII